MENGEDAALLSSRPSIVGHRGNHRSRLLYYLSQGVDFVEIDLNKSLRGELIAYHGDPLVTATTLTEALLKKMVSLVLCKDNPIQPLRFEEALKLIGKRARLWIDVKSEEVVKKALELLSDWGHDEVIVSSNDYKTLVYVKKERNNISPNLKVHIAVSISFKPPDIETLRTLVNKTGASVLSVEYSVLDELFLKYRELTGTKIAVWLVNSPWIMHRILQFSPDYVITDRPDMIINELHNV